MGGNEDLYKGMEMFAEGMAQYHTTQAVNDATEQLKNLNSREMSRQDQLLANEKVGQELALRLTAAGAKPEQIQAATQGLTPSASATATVEGQGQQQKAGFTHSLEMENLKHKHEMEQQKLKNEALFGKEEKKAGDKRGAFITGYQNKFNKETEKLTQGIQAMQTAEQILKSGNPIGEHSVGVMFTRASGDVGAVSDWAEQKYKGTKDVLGRIEEAKSEWLTGHLSKKNKNFLIELSGEYQKAKKSQKDEIAQKYANQAHSAATYKGFETTPEAMKRAITGERPEEQAQGPKIETGRDYSETLRSTRINYSDGTSKIVPGRQTK